jgi:hypothetical protein
LFGYSPFSAGVGAVQPRLNEQQGLVLLKEYSVLWKKPSLDMTLLAQLRSQGLGYRKISKVMAAPLATVTRAIQRQERKNGKCDC